jgi:hypothetical protein
MDGLPYDIILDRQFIFDNYLSNKIDNLHHAAETQLGIENNTDGALEKVFCFIREKTSPFLKRLRSRFFQTQSQPGKHSLDLCE